MKTVRLVVLWSMLLCICAQAADPDRTLSVKVRYTHATPLEELAEPQELVEEYTVAQLKRFFVFKHMFGGIKADQDAAPIPLSEPTILPTDFSNLVRMANPDASYTEREIDTHMKQNPDHLLRVYNTAFVLTPVDQRTTYSAALAILAHTKSLPEEKRQAFLEQQPAHTTVQLVDDINALMLDTEYTPESVQEPVRDAVLAILTTPYVVDTLTNNQARGLIDGIKKRVGKKEAERGQFIERVRRYLDDKFKNGEFPAVPQGAGVKPTKGYFPLSLKDLDDYDYMPPVKRIDLIDSFHFLLTDVVCLHLYNAHLTSLEPEILGRFPHMQVIALSNNNLTTLEPEVFSSLPLLQEIDLRNNKLATLKAGVFANLPMLGLINLSNNNLTTLEVGTFANLPALSRVDLSKNKLLTLGAGLFSNLPALVAISVSGNQLTTLEPKTFSNLPVLEEVQLGWNKLATLAVDAFFNVPALEEIYLNYNPFTQTEKQIRDANPTLPATVSIRTGKKRETKWCTYM